ncbi:hypothetical protein [Nocardioides sp. zg-DK7169]|uniref:hypothetical protein n=1 Tax=Nocardioides sp. zg-DK7169 TaxID=2736600 RepID=UPI001556E0D3|nr:hypothetical protein [Nocardioides sp. zg-DK7169]NPC96512.1 hypothetical protein [Nocardioides sp. zg-DK7169]
MTSGPIEIPRRLWGALNAVMALLVVGYGAAFTVLVVGLGTDHGETVAQDWLWPWGLGALGGLATALLAGRHDRRYLPWTAPLALAGACAFTGVNLDLGPLPALLAVLVAVSVVWHASTGRHAERRAPRHALLTGVLATVVALSVVGAAAGHVVVGSRTTPEYDAMRTDPLASDRLPGLTVRFDWSKDNTTPFGMASPAQVSRSWIITDGATTTEKIVELAALAAHHGWARGPDPTYCGWRKQVEGHPLCLVIRPGTDAGEVLVEIRGD